MTKSLLIVLTLAIAAGFTFFSGAYGQEETLCRGVPLNMNESQKAMITDCLTENKIKSVWKIPVEKLSCFGVCVLKKKGLLTPGGKLDHEKIFKYIDQVMKPDEIVKPLKDGIDKCIKEHGEKVQADNDPKCSTFLEVGQCVHDIFFDLCFIDDDRR